MQKLRTIHRTLQLKLFRAKAPILNLCANDMSRADWQRGNAAVMRARQPCDLRSLHSSCCTEPRACIVLPYLATDALIALRRMCASGEAKLSLIPLPPLHPKLSQQAATTAAAASQP